MYLLALLINIIK